MSEFNLLDEKWIVVLYNDGKRREVSLIEIFQDAQNIACLANELPTLDVAVLRLLLAILHASVGRDIKDYQDGIDVWKNLWDKGLPTKEIIDYLENWRDRFWLFDEKRPFYQVARLANLDIKIVKASKLIGDLSESANPKSARQFPMYSGVKKERISFSEAARWLLYTNAFVDTAAKKSSEYKGKSKDEQESIGPGWLGELGLIYAIDGIFEKTLLLNFCLLNDDFNPWQKAKPYWEIDNPCIDERRSIILPKSQIELLTLQSRRLLLVKDIDAVIGYKILGGDFFSKENAYKVEMMSAWNRPKGKEYFLPIEPSPTKQLWRDFNSLMARGKDNNRPGVVNWLSELEYNDMLEYEGIVSLMTTGVVYDDGQRSTIEDVIADSLSFNVSLLSALGKGWIENITQCLIATDSAVNAVGTLAWELFLANGGDEKDKSQNDYKKLNNRRNAAKQEAYFRLDGAFRKWLVNINPKTDKMIEKSDEWKDIARTILFKLGNDMIDEIGTKEFIGVATKDKKGKPKKDKNGNIIYINALTAYNNFEYGKWGINKCLGKEGENVRNE